MALPSLRDRRLAQAFMETLGGEGAEGLAAFKVLAAWAAELPGRVSGTSQAGAMMRLVKEALSRSGLGGDGAMTAAAAFLCLITAKGALRHAAEITLEAERILEEQNRVVRAELEAARPPGKDLEARIILGIKRRTGAQEVRLVTRLRPELTGGFRLKLGDEVIDSSVLGLTRQMTSDLGK